MDIVAKKKVDINYNNSLFPLSFHGLRAQLLMLHGEASNMPSNAHSAPLFVCRSLWRFIRTSQSLAHGQYVARDSVVLPADIYGNMHYITNGLCKNVLKLATP